LTHEGGDCCAVNLDMIVRMK